MSLAQKLLTEDRSNIVFRSFAQAGSTTLTSSLVINKPSGVVAGDTLMAMIVDAGPGSITPPSGWTQLFNSTWHSSSYQGAVFIKYAGSSEPSTYTFSGTDNYMSGVIAAYSGGTSAMYDVFGTKAEGSAASVSASGITTSLTTTVLQLTMDRDNTDTTYTPPASGWTNRIGVDGGGYISFHISDKSPQAGATGTIASVSTIVTNGWATWLLALK